MSNLTTSGPRPHESLSNSLCFFAKLLRLHSCKDRKAGLGIPDASYSGFLELVVKEWGGLMQHMVVYILLFLHII